MLSIQKLAHIYAVKTTSTKCAYMHECKECKNITCDYKARYVAFIEGYKTAKKD